MANGTLPLTGIRVIDLSQFEAGPSAAQLLGFFGAEVIKVEQPGTGEPGRTASADGTGMDAFYFLMLNANKRSITLDLKQEDGLRLFGELVRDADVVIHNFAPGTAERLGVDHESLMKINAKIICAANAGYGRGTKYEKFRSFDPVAQAAGGAVSLTGDADGPPVRPGPTFADTGGGLLAVIGILLSLLDRARSDTGQEVEVALQESVINFCRVAFARQAMTGEPGCRVGNGLQVPSAPSGVYPCSPGDINDYIFLYTGRGPVGDKNWNAFLEAIGSSDLIGDSRYSTGEARVENEGPVNEIVEAWTTRHTKFEVMETLGSVGVPVSAVFDTSELINDDGLRARGAMVDVDHPERGRYVMPGAPLQLSGSDVVVTPPPLLGEANAYVFGEILHRSEEEIADLEARGVI